MTTLAQLRTRARQRADMENSTFVADSELTTYVNESYNELYELIIQAQQDYFVTSTTLTLASGDAGVASIPSTVYKVLGIDKQAGDTYQPLRTYTWDERHAVDTAAAYRIVGESIRITPTNQAAGTYLMWYIPSLTALSSDSDVVLTSISRNGWDKYIAIDAAIKMRDKEESDIRTLVQQKLMLTEAIKSAVANRDAGQPIRIADTRGMNADWDDLLWR